MIRSDEHGRILLGTEESPITTYAINAAGWVEAMLRAESVAAWETAAESRHLLIRVGTEVHEHPVLDEQGNPVPAWDGAYDRTETRTYDDGDYTVYIVESLVPAEHVHIARAPKPVLTRDSETGEATSWDERPHYNLRIGPWAQETLADDGVTPRWQETVLMWMNLGAPIDEAEKNKAEDGIKLSDITLIDPTTINSPAMRW